MAILCRDCGDEKCPHRDSVHLGSERCFKEKAAKSSREAARVAFEADAGPYDFDLTRTPGEPLSPEPWAEYVDEATGHRWAGWLARTGEA